MAGKWGLDLRLVACFHGLEAQYHVSSVRFCSVVRTELNEDNNKYVLEAIGAG
jgi:hypothetical protein